MKSESGPIGTASVNTAGKRTFDRKNTARDRGLARYTRRSLVALWWRTVRMEHRVARLELRVDAITEGGAR